MTGDWKRQWNIEEIEHHLKSAVDAITPNVLDQVDLSTPQDRRAAGSQSGKILSMRRRVRAIKTVLAACLCVICLAGGIQVAQNRKVDSVIGIDVNPSVELSVNRKNKVLEVNPLNGDAIIVLEDMELKNVDLNIAMNALIGSMVKHGFLDDLDNAILVSVKNEDEKKAADLRSSVVDDIERSLEENQVQAVVYDQQAVEADDVQKMADEYGISYGKAYFLKELITQNMDLTEEDMADFADMTMEEIAKEITERSYVLGEKIDKTKEPTKEETTAQETFGKETATAPPETTPQETTAATVAPETTPQETTAATVAPETTPAATTPAETEETTEEDSGTGKVKIDNMDYEGGLIEIDFAEKVKWKNPTISVQDEDGAGYAAKVTDTSATSCQVEVEGLIGGKRYTLTIGGVAPKSGGRYTSVKGSFTAPDISPDATVGSTEGDETEPEETESTAESTTAAESGSESAPAASSEAMPTDGAEEPSAAEGSEAETGTPQQPSEPETEAPSNGNS